MFINKSRLLALPRCHPIVQRRKNPWQLTLWKVCFSPSPQEKKKKKKKEKHNMYLKAKWTRSSRKNNFTSPAAIRQPTAQTTWPFFLPVLPPGVTTQGHCAQSGVVGTLGAQLRTNGDRADSIFPCSGSVHVLILKLSPRENTSLFKFFKTTTNLHFSHVFYFDKKSLPQAEVHRGKYRMFVTRFGRIFSEVSPGTPPILVLSWDKREKPTGLRTNENKGSGLRPSSNSALMRLVWAEGCVPRQPGVLPVTQFQDQGRGCYSLPAAIMWGSLESGASL